MIAPVEPGLPSPERFCYAEPTIVVGVYSRIVHLECPDCAYQEVLGLEPSVNDVVLARSRHDLRLKPPDDGVLIYL